MSVLVYIESDGSAIKKSSFEAATYAAKLAEVMSCEVVAIAPSLLDDNSLAELGKFGITVVKKINNDAFIEGNIMVTASVLAAIANEEDSVVVIMSHSTLGEGVVSRLGIKLKASVATNVIGLPDVSNGFLVKRSIYTSKAFSFTELTRDIKILTVKKNSFEYETAEGSASVVSQDASTFDSDLSVRVLETKKQEGDVLLPEASLVVSAGRGLKGSENWGMIEELADVLGAATACSKPVSDIGWRPHHEHVGQTGIKVSPNLYIAIGISGAIQHLAGVSSSKVIVAINIDPEAPFFKAADYGIVGDAFDVVPKLIEAFRAELG